MMVHLESQVIGTRVLMMSARDRGSTTRAWGGGRARRPPERALEQAFPENPTSSSTTSTTSTTRNPPTPTEDHDCLHLYPGTRVAIVGFIRLHLRLRGTRGYPGTVQRVSLLNSSAAGLATRVTWRSRELYEAVRALTWAGPLAWPEVGRRLRA
eukprot:3433749-Rhodomonas_salina.1